MHRIHHSPIVEETNSNYGFFLSIWDKIFKTYKDKAQNDEKIMDIGLEAFRSDYDQRVDQLLIQPFKRG